MSYEENENGENVAKTELTSVSHSFEGEKGGKESATYQVKQPETADECFEELERLGAFDEFRNLSKTEEIEETKI